MITKLIDRFELWPDMLNPVALAHNSSVHGAMGYCPHELFYSFRPSCPLDVLVDTPGEESASNADEYAMQVAERLRTALAFMAEHTGRVTEKMRSNYDAAIKLRIIH